MRRSKLVRIINLSIIICFTIASIILSERLLFFIPLIVVGVFTVIVSNIEHINLYKNIKMYFDSKDLHNGIKYLKTRANTCLLPITTYSCMSNIVIFYMMLDEIDSAKGILNKNKHLKKSRNIFYNQFLLAIDSNDLNNIRYFYTKTQSLKNKVFNNQKTSSKAIMKMIKDEEFNQKIHDETLYPVLKRICLRYVDDTSESNKTRGFCKEKQNLLISNDRIKENRFFKVKSNLLFIISCCTLVVGMIYLSFKVSSYEPVTSWEGGYYFLKHIKVLLYLLPITLSSLIFGIIYKVKKDLGLKNIVIGIAMSIMLIGFGSFHFMFKSSYSKDIEYISYIRSEVNIFIPDNSSIITFNTIDDQKNLSGNKWHSMSVIRFNDENSNRFFQEKLHNNSHWYKGLMVDIEEFIPDYSYIETIGYDYFFSLLH